MPPSGFSQEAINGLLDFVRSNYEVVSERYKGSGSTLSERDFLLESSRQLETQVGTVLNERFPNSASLNGGIEGLTTFMVECYRDLAKEIDAGEDKHHRPVIDGSAIQKELDQIGKYLKDFTI